MHKESHFGSWGIALTFVVIAVLLLGASATLASPPAEPFHQGPTDTPIPAPAPSSGGSTGFLAELDGFVWQEGDPFKPLVGVTVRYTSDGARLDVTTDKRGYFKFVNIGPDLGILDLADNQWQSGTGGVIVQPPPGWSLRANLAALPKAQSLASKVTLTSSASSQRIKVGETVTFTLKVLNGTVGVVSGLTLGDQLPEGVALSGAISSRGDVIGRSSNAVTVDLNTLSPGDSATVTLVARADQAVPASAANRATLFYREGPAVSAQTAIGVAGGPATLPVTGVGLPILAVVVLAIILMVARRLRVRSAI